MSISADYVVALSVCFCTGLAWGAILAPKSRPQLTIISSLGTTLRVKLFRTARVEIASVFTGKFRLRISELARVWLQVEDVEGVPTNYYSEVSFVILAEFVMIHTLPLSSGST